MTNTTNYLNDQTRLAQLTGKAQGTAKSWARAKRLKALIKLHDSLHRLDPKLHVPGVITYARSFLSTNKGKYSQILDEGKDLRNAEITSMIANYKLYMAIFNAQTRPSKGDPTQQARAGAPKRNMKAILQDHRDRREWEDRDLNNTPIERTIHVQATIMKQSTIAGGDKAASTCNLNLLQDLAEIANKHSATIEQLQTSLKQLSQVQI